MPRRSFGRIVTSVVVCAVGIAAAAIFAREYESGKIWPEPKVVTPGEHGSPPSDAIVLFDGKDLSQWDGGHWTVKDGAVTAGGGDMHTKKSFGPDYQLHVEWAEPEKVVGSSQGRGNSGVFLADRYELQVLDSYNNPTYYDGQCASIYKQWPPLVNACRKPGEWQTYDIVFESPRFDEKGKLLKPGYETVLQNGILVQNHSEIIGSTSWDQVPAYSAHPPKEPIRLQYHGNPVRFRNIWVREVHPLVPKKG
ncbi:MAG TPA: DUF1080 domain-containing protein [Pirellulales bacterium]|jgi:hypothetical protein|nr:DUF1080 domain-containing protein [Pirellulales bacterium]